MRSRKALKEPTKASFLREDRDKNQAIKQGAIQADRIKCSRNFKDINCVEVINRQERYPFEDKIKATVLDAFAEDTEL